MPLQIIRNDITKIHCDAIVNSANSSLLGGGGVDGMIHQAAGSELLKECEKLGGCETGQVKVTAGYNLPCKYIIHAVGPKWRGGNYQEEQLLRSCYKNSLETATKYNCETVAFPLISSGIYGYPKEDALAIAIDEISKYLFSHEIFVYLVIFDKNSFVIDRKLKHDIEEFITKKYLYNYINNRRNTESNCFSFVTLESSDLQDINNILNNRDESFCEMLFRIIDEKGLKDSDVYKKANIDRRLFSKIRSNINYAPSKYTAVALAIALELDLDETNVFLKSAGFALSNSNNFDMIIKCLIEKGLYDINQINAVLFDYDQRTLGGL